MLKFQWTSKTRRETIKRLESDGGARFSRESWKLKIEKSFGSRVISTLEFCYFCIPLIDVNPLTAYDELTRRRKNAFQRARQDSSSCFNVWKWRT